MAHEESQDMQLILCEETADQLSAEVAVESLLQECADTILLPES